MQVRGIVFAVALLLVPFSVAQEGTAGSGNAGVSPSTGNAASTSNHQNAQGAGAAAPQNDNSNGGGNQVSGPGASGAAPAHDSPTIKNQTATKDTSASGGTVGKKKENTDMIIGIAGLCVFIVGVAIIVVQGKRQQLKAATGATSAGEPSAQKADERPGEPVKMDA